MNDDVDDVDARFVECGNGYGRVVFALYIYIMEASIDASGSPYRIVMETKVSYKGESKGITA